MAQVRFKLDRLRRKDGAASGTSQKTGKTGAAASSSDERTRRRFERRQRARRWLAWRRVLVIVLVLAVVGFVGYAVLFSSWLAADKVSIDADSGSELTQVSQEQVEEAAGVPIGKPMARIDLDRIRSRVEALAPVREAEVTRKWPHTVRIAVTERTPVAVVELGAGLRNLDADGVLFGAPKRVPAKLPRVELGSDVDQNALREAAGVASSMDADLLARVDHLKVVSMDEILLVLTGGRVVHWGSADQSEDKAVALTTLLDSVPKAQSYDVTVPAQPATSDRLTPDELAAR